MKTLSKLAAATAALAMTSTSAFAANIVETAASTGQINTLIAAAMAAGLAGARTGEGLPFRQLLIHDGGTEGLGLALMDCAFKHCVTGNHSGNSWGPLKYSIKAA